MKEDSINKMSNTITDTARERVKINERFKNNDYFKYFKHQIKATQVSHFQLEVKTIPDIRQINELARFYDVEYRLVYDKEKCIINAVVNINNNFVDNLNGLITQFLRLNQQKQKNVKYNHRLSKLQIIYKLIFVVYTLGTFITALVMNIYNKLSVNTFETFITAYLLIAFGFIVISHFVYKKQVDHLKSKFYRLKD